MGATQLLMLVTRPAFQPSRSQRSMQHKMHVFLTIFDQLHLVSNLVKLHLRDFLELFRRVLQNLHRRWHIATTCLQGHPSSHGMVRSLLHGHPTTTHTAISLLFIQAMGACILLHQVPTVLQVSHMLRFETQDGTASSPSEQAMSSPMW